MARAQLKGEQRKEDIIQSSNNLTRKRRIKVVPTKLLGSKNVLERLMFFREQAEASYEVVLGLGEVRSGLGRRSAKERKMLHAAK